MVEIPDLSDDEWEELVERLTLHAFYKLRKLYWRGVDYTKGGAVPGGVCPEDLAAEAFESYLDGSRKWNREAQPNFLWFLKGTIDSKVSHLVESTENKESRRIDTGDREREPAFQLKSRMKRPGEIVTEAEQKELTRKAVIGELDGDPMAQSLFECYEADITKPQEIAEMLGVEVADVNNARKRLGRCANKAFDKIGRSRR